MLSLYPSMLPVIGGDCKFCEMFLQFEVTCTYNGRHKYIRVFRRLDEVGEKDMPNWIQMGSNPVIFGLSVHCFTTQPLNISDLNM